MAIVFFVFVRRNTALVFLGINALLH